MAEVLGVVSGGISIAGFALQLADKIVQIKSFLDTVKSAPAEIQQHLEDVQLLTEILLDLDSQRPIGSHGDKTSRRCAMQCQRAAELASQFLNDLQVTIKRRRIRGSVEFALKKRDDLDRLLKRLEAIKSTLHVAHMISQRQHQVLMSELAERQHNAIQHLAAQVTSNVGPTSCLSETSPSSMQSKPLTLKKSQHKTSRKPTYRLGLPAWLGGKVWEIYTSSAQIEWAFRVRTYNIIPNDSRIFKLAKAGDTHGLDSLLRSNAASVFDCDWGGQTALHVAAYWGHVSACQLLLDRGADPSAMMLGSTPLQRAMLLASLHIRLPFEHNLKGCITMLIPRTQDMIIECSDSFLHTDDIETLQQLIAAMYPPFYQRPLSERIRLCSGRFIMGLKPELIPLVLKPEEREKISCYRQQILPILASSYGHNILNHMEDFNGYVTLLAKILCDYPHQQEEVSLIHGQEQQSLLMTFFQSCMQFTWNIDPYAMLQGSPAVDIKRSIVRVLTRALQIAGIDLLQFGRTESLLLAKSSADKDIRASLYIIRKGENIWLFYEPNITIRLIGFRYGPAPEDWHCWFSDFTDAFVGEFWNMVENVEPEGPMPGSWVD